jgi:hypothetical protein
MTLQKLVLSVALILRLILNRETLGAGGWIHAALKIRYSLRDLHFLQFLHRCKPT